MSEANHQVDFKPDDIEQETNRCDWFNVNNDLIFSRTFAENCILYTSRSGGTITIHTINSQDDIQIMLPKEQDAVRVMKLLETVLNENKVESVVNFENEMISAEGI